MKNELESNQEIQQAGVKNSADIRELTPKDRHAVRLTDGDEIFFVPRRYAAKICAAIPEVRHSFEHLGGRHLGHVSQSSETVRHAEEHDDNPERTAEPEELKSAG